jgi:hypothetical protein
VDIKIISMDVHRNGISGEPFYPIIFESEGARMLGVVFGESGYCAVLNLDVAAAGDIRFFYNSFRGDRFEGELRKAITAFHEGAYQNDYQSKEPTRHHGPELEPDEPPTGGGE